MKSFHLAFLGASCLALSLPGMTEARGNLSLCAVPEKSRKTVAAAIDAFQEMQKAKDSGKRLNAVITKLEGACARASKVPQLYYYLGIGYQMSEKFSLAKRRLETATKLNPDFHEALVEYGDVFVWLKDYENAVKQYDRALEIEPTYELGMDRRVHVLIRLGKLEAAKAQLQRALEIKKTDERVSLLVRVAMTIKGPKWPQTFTVETKSYIVSTSISQDYANKIAEAAERIRRAYRNVFSKTKRPDRKFPIYIHSSREEYVKNGGPPMAGGHYQPTFRTLHLFKRKAFRKTIETLNHEAFHHFIHDYIERPPQWFNEGLADYFGSFKYLPKQKKIVPRLAKDRLRWIQPALRRHRYPSPADLMQMSQAEMYDPRMIGVHYAQSWSLVYFMLQSKKGYQKVLGKYFRVLREGKNIDEAFRATFGRIDMTKFEKEWRSFINSIR